MNTINIIQKYYDKNSELYKILLEHSQNVASFAVEIAAKHPELKADEKFIHEASMLHDIAIFMTNAPDIHCHGDKPYITHGYLGREILENEELERHALVCERHTGAGLTIADIQSQQLPVPLRDMLPVSIEEQIICYADKFYSKSGELSKRKPVEKIIKKMEQFGKEQTTRFLIWHERFNF